MNLLTAVLPWWARWGALLLAGLMLVAIGRMWGQRIEGEKHTEYVIKQAQQTAKIAQAQARVVVRTEIKYRDRIQKIFVKGETIEKEVPVYVTQADNAHCTVNVGFVRSYNAAWSGDPAGPAADSDREPAGIPLSEVAETDAFNATVCRAWKEQALGWREHFGKLKAAINNPDMKGGEP